MLRHYSHASIAISHGKFAGEMEGVALRNIKMDSRCIHAILLVHYLLQMIHGLRAQGADVGAAFNILFYTPVAFAITLSIINIESTGNKLRRYCLRGMMAYILIAIVFRHLACSKVKVYTLAILLYVMLGLFVASMAYFILIIRKETKARKQKLIGEFRNRLDSIRALFASQHHFAILCCWTPSCSNPLQYLIIYNRSLDITLCHLFRPHFHCYGLLHHTQRSHS